MDIDNTRGLNEEALKREIDRKYKDYGTYKWIHASMDLQSFRDDLIDVHNRMVAWIREQEKMDGPELAPLKNALIDLYRIQKERFRGPSLGDYEDTTMILSCIRLGLLIDGIAMFLYSLFRSNLEGSGGLNGAIAVFLMIVWYGNIPSLLGAFLGGFGTVVAVYALYIFVPSKILCLVILAVACIVLTRMENHFESLGEADWEKRHQQRIKEAQKRVDKEHEIIYNKIFAEFDKLNAETEDQALLQKKFKEMWATVQYYIYDDPRYNEGWERSAYTMLKKANMISLQDEETLLYEKMQNKYEELEKEMVKNTFSD